MNQKTLIGLAVAALVAIGIAVFVNRSNQPRSESGGEQTKYLVPELRDHVNDVNKLVVTEAGNKVVATIEHGDKGWSVAEKSGYPADTGKLREFLLKLADAKLVEQKTASKDKYSLLGVDDVADKDAKGVEVEIDGLAKPIKLIVGNANTHGGGTFVRRAGDAQSWLVSGTVSVEKKAQDWLRKDLADIPAKRIASVTITHPDGNIVRAKKDAEGDANFKLEDVPKGREPGSEFSINGLAATLSSLRFDDIAPAKDAEPADKAINAHYATFDGLAIDVTAWEKDGKDYAQLIASVDQDRADQHITDEQAKAKSDYEAELAAAKAKASAEKKPAGESAKPPAAPAPSAEPPKPASVADPAKDREDKLAALDKEVADLNSRFKDWTYVLPAYKYSGMNKSLDDLLKPVESKKPEKSAKGAAKAKKKGH